MRAGRAVASEIVVDGWRRHLGYDGPDVSPAEAGAALARISAEHDLTFYAHYHTDTAGHRGGMSGAVEALERVDAFLGGLLDHLDPAAALVLASDHGNIEDVRAGHTTHPALLLVARGAVRATGRTTPGDLTDVKPLLLELLGSDDPPPH
ncbi:MAG: hypothetical protein D6701_01185 [Gemmatimonadetes bacterium]|nr:MAG: hypothetical protein D6701_01185 [Gemmatimonadota bacterium]